ncbi:protein crooked neck [Blastocladiella britannica]|nr:protein crooked neck [Blastocladiella britannica]
MHRSGMQRATRVKNKNPAEIQITAEQILREATDAAEEAFAVPKQTIADEDELLERRFQMRKQFEDVLRRTKFHIGYWLKYAKWEEQQRELDRARSVYERVLEIDPRNPAIWIQYAEMEMRAKNINLARNLWDRAVTQLPRVDSFWYKYAYMEEMLSNHAKARQIFERWMTWKPAEDGWLAYIAFELRYKEAVRARELHRRLVECHPDPHNWIAYAAFEEDQGAGSAARGVFEEAVQYLGDANMTPALWMAFAKLETRLREYERARAIYTYALQTLPKSAANDLYRAYTQFEKTHGDRAAIERAVAAKRRHVYADEVVVNPANVDAWLDLIGVDEASGDLARARDTYERAVGTALPPPAADKRLWRRYLYLWLQYAAFEETRAHDVDRARAVYKAALDVVPHARFTFAKLWLAYARFLVRVNGDVAEARKVLGLALGVAPKPRLFKGYIDLELTLREFDRVRALYGRFVEHLPANVYAWIKYAELESMLGETERARGVFEIAIAQEALDMPEVLWKAFIDFEMEQEEWENTRQLYERLLERTTHVKVWISYAKYELQAEEFDDVNVRAERSRAIFERASKVLKGRRANEERVILLESWRDFESEFGTAERVQKIGAQFPRIIKRQRRVGGGDDAMNTDDGGHQSLDDSAAAAALTEDYFEYLWPDEEIKKPSLKLLAKAHEWKAKQEAARRARAAAEAEAAAAAAEANGGDDDEEEEENGTARPSAGQLAGIFGTGATESSADVAARLDVVEEMDEEEV